MSKSFKDHSRVEWHPSGDDDSYPGHDRIQLGCLQRIADATELMAKDREKLIRDYEYMRNDRNLYQEWYRKEARKITALKGVITKLKKRLEKEVGNAAI